MLTKGLEVVSIQSFIYFWVRTWAAGNPVLLPYLDPTESSWFRKCLNWWKLLNCLTGVYQLRYQPVFQSAVMSFYIQEVWSIQIYISEGGGGNSPGHAIDASGFVLSAELPQHGEQQCIWKGWKYVCVWYRGGCDTAAFRAGQHGLWISEINLHSCILGHIFKLEKAQLGFCC